MAATSSPKKFPRGQPKSYSTVLLYNLKEAAQKLKGLTLAACNPKLEKQPVGDSVDEEEKKNVLEEPLTIKVSDKMLCSLCDATFMTRSDQKNHYKSDWHRYNIKQRLKGKLSVSEGAFDEMSGNVSSISGSDSDSDLDSDANRTTTSAELKSRPKPAGLPSHLTTSGNTSTDSESESGQSEDVAQRLPKVYFRSADGELISLYRCVLCHKKWQPTKQTDLLSLAEELPDHMMWALFMAGGGHFAGAIFNIGNLVVHKTFHRYVVRAKRGTAQGSRDSQGGNAPKSAGASLRRYNEAALTQDIQDLITSWNEHIQLCDKIFLRAPSFNRKIFFGGKSPPFKKDDMRIRLIPFQTRRPTFNEVRRVFELLASVECYGDESEIQDFIPISPPKVFDVETGQLSPRDENQLSPRRRKFKNKVMSASPLVGQGQSQEASEGDGTEADLQASDGTRVEDREYKGREPCVNDFKRQEDPGQENLKLALPEHLTEAQNSAGTSTNSESELVENMETMNMLEHKEFYATKKPKTRKKQTKRRKNSLRCQKSPESNVFEEERYHLKNSLYTACKIGDFQSLTNLLAIFSVQNLSQQEIGQSCGTGVEPCDLSCDQNEKSSDQSKEQFDQSSKTCNTNMEQKLDGLTCDNDRVSAENSESNIETSESEKYKVMSHGADDSLEEHVNDHSKTDCDKSVLKENSQDNLMKFSISSHSIKSDENISRTDDEQTNKNLTSDNSTEIYADKSIGDKKVRDTVETVNENLENKTIIIDKSMSIQRSGESAFITSVETDSALQTEKEMKDVRDEIVITGDGDKVVDISTTVESFLPLNKPDKVQLTGSLSDLSPIVTVGILSETFGDNETTLLHVAAREGHTNIVTVLMAAGADPAIRDRAGLTPYMVSKDKQTRNEFRKFMGQWPDKYDYARAQIPPPLSEEQENERKRKEMERKKAQKKAKQERQKEKRIEEAAKEAEEREKNRFLALSDREKRALAAERRLIDQASREGVSKPVLSRCFQCASDMTGKVPFEYMDYKFCSSKCLQQHRKQKSSK